MGGKDDLAPHVRALLDRVYAQLPDPSTEARRRKQALQPPTREFSALPPVTDPDPHYPWLNRSAVNRIRAMPPDELDGFARRFRDRYGFDYWNGPGAA